MKNSFASQNQLRILVQTSSIKGLETFIRSFDKRVFLPIGLITSDPGYGKTMAVAYLARYIFNESVNPVHLSTLLVTIPPAPTNRAIAEEILDQLEEELPKGRRSANQLAKHIADKLIEFSIERIFFDEGNRLNSGTYDFIRAISDALNRMDVNIKIFLIGTDEILTVIKTEAQFRSRTLRHLFAPLTEAEVVDEFLPKLKIEGWSFNRNRKKDRDLAASLWKSCAPSLRDLVFGIEQACSMVSETDEKLDFGGLIELARYYAHTIDDTAYDTDEVGASEDGNETDDESKPIGPHEERSVNRHNNRRRKRKQLDA